jgi:flavin reductase (DIM6/NTAB) family NADH-FMN oxidoreductase RutF
MTPEEIRHTLGHFATGVTVVTSLGADGAPVGMTASAVSSLSLDPPLLLVCLKRNSTTLAAIQAHGGLAVNILSASQRALSSHFARGGLAATWDEVGHSPGARGLPLLDGALATIECELERCLDGGDHQVVIARMHAHAVSEVGLEPLLHFRGAYAALASEALAS